MILAAGMPTGASSACFSTSMRPNGSRALLRSHGGSRVCGPWTQTAPFRRRRSSSR